MMARDTCEHLDPWLVEFAATATDDPRRNELLDTLVEGFLPVARNIARRFAGRGQAVDDLEQVAAIGLLGALRRYRPDRGRDFLSFAVPTMMGEVRRHFRDHAWAVRTPRGVQERYLLVNAAVARLSQQLDRAPTMRELAEDLDLPDDEVAEALAAGHCLRPVSLDERLTSEDGGDTLADVLGGHDESLDRAEARAMVRRLVLQLPVRERRILALRFVHDRTQQEIAEAVGISQMHVSRLLTRSLAMLRDHVEQQVDVVAPAAGGAS